MKWSLKLGRFFGIDLYVHFTFLLLLAFVAFQHISAGDDLLGTAWGVLFIVAVFGCVVLHEYGHALTARRFGVPTHDITLLPIGGVARLARIPERPIEEFWVAVAGPAVNVVIAGVLFAALSAAGAWRPITAEMAVAGDAFLQQLAIVNVALVVFNMLPAFPMDGGRVLRSLLATQLGNLRATQIAAFVGQGMAVLFAIVGIFTNPMLLLIAVFVWFGATQELQMARVRSSLAGMPVFRAMINQFRVLEPDDTLDHAAALATATGQRHFPVTAGGSLVGVLLYDDLAPALERSGGAHRVARVMRSDVVSVEATQLLQPVLRDLAARGCPAAVVTHYGQLVGLLDARQVGDFFTAGRRGGPIQTEYSADTTAGGPSDG